MIPSPRSLTLVLAAALTAAGCAASGGSDGSAATLVTGGTLVDGTGAAPISDGAVLIRDGRISAVGPASEVEAPGDARRVDAAGGWILPGFVDAHVHFSQTGWFDGRPDAADVRGEHPYPEVVAGLRDHPERFYASYLCAGVTSVFDVGGYPWTRGLPARGETHPEAVRAAAAGALLSTVDFWLNLPDQRQFVFMASDSVVRAAVRSHAALGSDAIKVWYIVPGSWSPADSARFRGLVRVAGEEADSVGLPLIVHATGLWEAKEALRAGAEVLVHSVFEEPVDSAFLRLARDRDVVYTPTLTVVEGYANAYLGKSAGEMPYPARCVDGRTRRLYAGGLPEAARPPWARGPDAVAPENPRLRQGLENLARVRDAGITIATGTDAGNPGTAHGASYARELELMARAGMSPMEVIVASTRGAAGAMGRGDELGTLEAGKLGDVVVLGSSPLEDVRNAADVRATIKGGEVVYERSGTGQAAVPDSAGG